MTMLLLGAGKGTEGASLGTRIYSGGSADPSITDWSIVDSGNASLASSLTVVGTSVWSTREADIAIVDVRNLISLDGAFRFPSAAVGVYCSDNPVAGIYAPSATIIVAVSCNLSGSLVFPNATDVSIDNSSGVTSLTCNNATSVTAESCNLTGSVSFPAATSLIVSGNALLTALSCPNATTIYAENCGLNNAAVSDLLDELYAAGNSDGYLYLTGNPYNPSNATVQAKIAALESFWFWTVTT